MGRSHGKGCGNQRPDGELAFASDIEKPHPVCQGDRKARARSRGVIFASVLIAASGLPQEPVQMVRSRSSGPTPAASASPMHMSAPAAGAG